MHQNEP